MVNFRKFKRLFDESFGKVTPSEFVKKMEDLGYVFKSAYQPDSAESCFHSLQFIGDGIWQCEKCGITQTHNTPYKIS